MKLTEKHIRVANALSEGEKTQGEIAKEYGISARTIYNWEKDPNFQACLEGIKNRWKGIAQVMAGRWAVEAIKVLRKQMRSEEDEVSRKAAMDLLQIAGLKVEQVKGEGFANQSVFVIRANANGDESTKDDKVKDFSGRFRL
jgi:DNA-binding XRE family transcriptional regulator